MPLPSGLPASFNASVIPVREPGAVGRLLHTQVGDGPRVLEHVDGAAPENVKRDNGKTGLLNEQGEPIRLQRVKRA